MLGFSWMPAVEMSVVPWRAPTPVLAGYLQQNLLNGSFVNPYLSDQAYQFNVAGAFLYLHSL